jgi:alkanesulfonate monooxygenase SsuD/methylene tetrahydromethanopterin reductase-like flavin-dependent oxidoreductase (luciferase family)
MTEPLGQGTISLGLSARYGSGRDVVEGLVADAMAAVAAGFDGVTLSEHHGGFPHYVPSPLLLSGVLLSRMPRGFACAAPMVLPLRTPVTVAEDLAWLDSAYPDRVGAGFVPGYQQGDFDAVGLPFDTRRVVFWEGLAAMAGALGRRAGVPSPVAGDPAVAGLHPRSVPLLAGVGGPVGVRKAARLGAGLLVTSLRPASEAAGLVREYRESGGTGSVVLIRRVHVGETAAGFETSLADWSGRSGGADWLRPDDGALATGSPEAVAAALVDAVRTSGCSALNLRLDTYTHDASQVLPQLEVLGTEVVPWIREALGWNGTMPPPTEYYEHSVNHGPSHEG